MAVKAKAAKAKALAKKSSSLRPKKKEISAQDAYHEADVEQLELAQEALPKRGAKSKNEKDRDKEKDKEKKVLHGKEKAEAKPLASAETSSANAPISNPEVIAPIQPRVVMNKAAQPTPSQAPTQSHSQAQDSRGERVHHQETRPVHHNQSHKPQSNDGLKVRLSESLVKKLKDQASDEGISLEEFVAELLAESVVLRAWEIVERKNAMKGHSGQGQGPMGGGGRNNYNQGQGNKGNPNQRGGQGQGGGNQGNKGHRGMSHVRYQSIMDDKAMFLEYVRNQEKTRR
jgi:predicted DNA binding CopG/RHH family protein